MTLPPQLFVTGTNTDIGKTLVSGVLVAGRQAHYWKPVQTGLTEGATDTDWIRAHTGIAEQQIHAETYRFGEPLSPHAAARLDGAAIDLAAFQLPSLPEATPLVVEGAGGVLVPLNDHHFMLDLMKQLALPVLIVADSRLGTINHTLLSIMALREAQVEIAGVVMNGPENPGNRAAIEGYGQVPVVAEITPLEAISLVSLADCYRSSFIDP